MLTQLFKDEGLKEERLGFFFTFLFSPSLSFLHLKGRNFLYPIFIVIVMINWSLSLPLLQLSSSSSLLLSILYITTIFIVFIIIILNFVIFRNVIIITVISVIVGTQLFIPNPPLLIPCCQQRELFLVWCLSIHCQQSLWFLCLVMEILDWDLMGKYLQERMKIGELIIVSVARLPKWAVSCNNCYSWAHSMLGVKMMITVTSHLAT